MHTLSNDQLLELLDNVKRAVSRGLISHASYEESDAKGQQKMTITVCVSPAKSESMTSMADLIKQAVATDMRESLKIASGTK